MANNKKRAGQYPTGKVKGSNFLPKTFQTDTNKVWLDSTLDQMISKGNLKDYHGFFGSVHGKDRTLNDTYIDIENNSTAKQISQLQPGIVLKNNNNNITNTLTFEDVVNGISTNFTEYNYASAYSSQGFVFNPPVNIDMLVNFSSYYWVQNLPIYTAHNTGSTVDIFEAIQGQAIFELTDDNNTFELHTGMLIKFEGNWGATASENTYIVTGVGTGISLVLFQESNGKYRYSNQYKSNIDSDGYWDRNTVYSVAINNNSVYASEATSLDMIAAYNQDDSANKPVFFDGFNLLRHESNNDKLVQNAYVRFPDSAEVYYLDVKPGNITATVATTNNNLGLAYDIENWDYETIIFTDPEYIVIAKDDSRHTAWSRINNWVHINCINTYKQIMPHIDTTLYANAETQAKRSIIEFEPRLDMYNSSEYANENQWLGHIDFYVKPEGDCLPTESGNDLIMPATCDIAENSYVMFTDTYTSHIYRMTANNTLVQEKEITANSTAFIDHTDFEDLKSFEKQDVYFKNSVLTVGQSKNEIQQEPLFELFTVSGKKISEYDNQFFGNKLFGYKIGTGHTDPILGKKLSYKDTQKGAEYEFENYLQTFKEEINVIDDLDPKLSFVQKVKGYNFFKQAGKFATLYKTSHLVSGAFEHLQYIVNNMQTLEIPVGRDNYRPDVEYLVYKKNDRINLVQKSKQGVTVNKSVDQYKDGILTDNNSEIKLHNLVDGDFKFKLNGVDITSTAWDSSTETLTIGNIASQTNKSSSISVHFDDVANDSIFVITVVESINNQYHRLTVNGESIDPDLVTVNNNSTVVDITSFEEGDIIDFEFINNNNNNPTSNASFPTLWKTNSSNQTFDSFTVSETANHWKDMMLALPGFNGSVFGENNYRNSIRLQSYGGTIFLHEDSGIMHDMNYINNELSVTGALFEQGQDYDAFITRFRNQVKRIYASNLYNTTQEIIASALKTLLANKQGSDLYKTSNMLYTVEPVSKTFVIDNNQTEFVIDKIAGGDDNIRDHVYVWLTDDKDNNDKLVRRMLVKDTEYTVNGDIVTLLVTPQASISGQYPSVDIDYYQMDSQSYVPQSMVKLGLQLGQQPQIVNNTLVTHDGRKYELNENAELFDNESLYFDIVNAAQYELECMIYAGLVKQDQLYTNKDNYKNVDKYIPSQHRDTWYSLDQVNDYVYSYYSKWAKNNNQPLVIEDIITPDSDGWNWNYKDMSDSILGFYGNHFVGKLPGHYVGIYNILFGTATPHTTPWHMLGIAFKPQWWDTHYSWTDAAKRTALLDALKKGIISEPGTPVTQDPTYARYAWDWTNNCPVDTNGDLELPKVVLNIAGEPSVTERAKPFVFGDWGPTEQQFRQTAQCTAITIDAIVKLMPARAFTEFLQPGSIVEANEFKLSPLSNTMFNNTAFITPGYKSNKVLTEIKVLETDNFLNYQNEEAEIYGNRFHQKSLPVVNFDSQETVGTLQNIIINKRLFDVEYDVVFKSLAIAPPAKFEYIYTSAEYVANGIHQAQYNHIIRNRYTNTLEDNYKNLSMRLIQKANGFTRKDSVNFFAESGLTGSFIVADSDYNIVMHKGYPHTFVNASQVIIKKQPEGYSVSGTSSNRQEFKFVEPITNTSQPFTEVEISNRTIKKYKKFTNAPSVIDYGTTLNKIQDVYTFIRGYFTYLENLGFTLAVNKEAHANTFVRWTVTAEEGNEIVLDLGNKVIFESAHGHTSEISSLTYFANDVRYSDGAAVSNEELVVSRNQNTTTITNKTGATLGSATVAVLDYEHAFVFENKTVFGNLVYDDTKMLRQQRLLARGGVTQDWDGNKRAPGYLVFDDHIVQNFDSSVQETNEYYRTDVAEFNRDVKKAKDISIGNIDRDWMKNLHLDPNVVTKFYQGAIKEAGTNASVDRLARFIKGASDIQVYEKYMFNHSYFGDTTRKQSTEFKLMQHEIANRPQIIEFVDEKSVPNSIAITTNDNRFVNKNNIEFNIVDFDNTQTKLNTAGNPVRTESRYTSFNTTNMPSVYDTTADYATIESWSSTKSYNVGDVVRRQSALYRCLVDSTGLNTVNQGIFETGSISNPFFPSGTVVSIDNNPLTLNETAQVISDIVAQGTVANPVVQHLDQLVINNNVLTFTGTDSTQGVIGPAQLLGNIVNPTFQTVAGKTIQINGTVVDFDNIPNDVLENYAVINNGVTPGNVVETFTAAAAQTDFTIAQSLSASTYSVSSVIVDSTTTTDFTVVGQTLTINSPAMTGGETVEVTLVHATVIDLEDTYTISQTLSVIGYQLTQVIVDGNTLSASEYVLNGQDVTINNINNYSVGDSIQFRLEHVDNGMSTNDIIATITNTVPDVTATLQSGAILLEYTSANITATLVLSAGSVNAELGFNTSGETSNVVVGLTYAPLTMQEIIDQINGFASFGIDNITASDSNNQLVLTKTNIAFGEIMTIGTGATTFGFNSSYQYSVTTIPTEVSASSAVIQINNHLQSQGITDITVSRIDNRINISSTRQVLDFGFTTFNSIAGLPTGEQTNLETSVENIFTNTQWEIIDDSNDPTLFNIWVVNDSDYTVDSVNNVKTKFNGWNMFQVQNHGLYTRDDDDPDGCGICAGSATSDGNDAQITTISPHNLVEGDYVLLTNTTTQPNIDGIHKVTQVHPTLNNVFYIDKFINKCGNASSVMIIRPQRFENNTQRDLSASNIPHRSVVYSDRNGSNKKTTNVYKRTNTAELFEDKRFTNYRVANNDVENITIYDYDKNRIVKQLELFDPLRGVIPGIANAEIDVIDNVDTAMYNMSNDENYTVNQDNYWTNEQVGKRWWNTSTAIYYDYDQGDYIVQNSYWGELFPGSSIDVYEWTKSLIGPEEYDKAVQDSVEMFGVVATGTPYYVYDPVLQENKYYYSTAEEWNSTLSTYQTVYYFWVKNKLSVPFSKNISSDAVADIIENPTENGIAWFAALTPVSLNSQTTHQSSNAFIISNADLYLNDTSTVIQINRVPGGINHNSWTTIAKDNEMIPDYYYIGLRNNLATVDALETTLPNYYAHEYNRFGDDRTIAQTWFMDHIQARQNARIVINELLKDINLYKDYNVSWNAQFIANNMPDNTWKWTNFVSKHRNVYAEPTITVYNLNDIDILDTSIYNVVKLKIQSEGLDRSEIWEYINGVWTITEKANATIELEEVVARQRAGWDNLAWDTTIWDSTETRDWWRTIVDACRYDWFKDANVIKFNKLFFAMVDYVLGEQDQTNWVHKSTYVKLDITHNINSSVRKYTRSTVNNIIGYVETVKPFHTKVDEILDSYEASDSVFVSMEEDVKQTIFLDFDDLSNVFVGETLDGGTFANTDVQGSTSGNDWSYEETYDNGAFRQSDMYASESNSLRQHNLKVDFGAVTSFTVQTNTTGNTVDNDTRTFIMLKNMESNIPAIVALEENKATETTTELAHNGDTVTLTDASAFADQGIAYINNEFIQYNKVGNDLEVVKRSSANTFALQHVAGSVIIDVTDSFLTSAEVGTTMLNDMGESILTSTDSLAAVELQALGKGITL